MKTILWTIITAVPIFLFSGSLKADSNNGLQPFTIGAVVCLTGACAEWGTNSLEGVKFAVEELNKSGGALQHKIEVEVEDTQENDNKMRTVSALQTLLGKNIKYFIGPTWSEAGSVLSPILSKRSDVIAVSPTLGVSTFNEAGPNLFNTMLHSVTGTKKLARFAYAHGFKRVAIFSTQQTWCIDQAKNFEDEFQKIGGIIVAKVETLPSAADIRPEVMKIKDSNPELVFSTDMSATSPSPRELRKAGYTGSIMTPLIDETMLQKNGDALEGAYYYSDYSGTEEFEKKFIARFNHKPNTGADTGYNALVAIVGAINEAKSFDGKVVQPVLLKRTFKGATGEVHFDEQGGIVQDPKVFQIKSGTRVKVAD